MTTLKLPDRLIGGFFGVGSLGETNHSKPLEYVSELILPYTFQIPSNREEDMIRQFGVLLEGFEEDGDFLWEPNIHVYREILRQKRPLIPPKVNFPSLYMMAETGAYQTLKTQITAPITMSYNIRSTDGKKLVSSQMLPFFESLMGRIAIGMKEHLASSAEEIIFCQDDPSMAFVLEDIRRGTIQDINVKNLSNSIEKSYPKNVIPAYHYCGDWREANLEGIHLLWDGAPKIIHIDLLSYPPKIPARQAEKLNRFIKEKGVVAMGLIPNTDDGIRTSVLEDLKTNLERTIQVFQKAGVDTGLLLSSSMISTQCGLSGASQNLTREVHESSSAFPSILKSFD